MIRLESDDFQIPQRNLINWRGRLTEIDNVTLILYLATAAPRLPAATLIASTSAIGRANTINLELLDPLAILE